MLQPWRSTTMRTAGPILPLPSILARPTISRPPPTPHLFLVHADDDKVVTPLDHSIRLYVAWKKLAIPAELHIYSAGGHGFGTRKITAGTWTDRFRDWLDVQGLLKHPQS